MKNVRFIGLDVHAESIAVAVAEVGGEVRSLGTIPNRAESVGRLIRKLGKPESLRVCYEAGPTGYVLYWQLTELGVRCEVMAPTKNPILAHHFDAAEHESQPQAQDDSNDDVSGKRFRD